MSKPLSVDLIYLDIEKDIKSIEHLIKLRTTEIEEVRGEMKGLPPRSSQLEVKKTRIYTMSADKSRFLQLKKYMEIKKKKRASIAKIKYELRFKEKLSWPDKEEFRLYILEKGYSMLPVEEINKSDSSRSSTHEKDVNKILKEHNLFK